MAAAEKTIAIIGAGMCGLTIASALAPHASVTLFEKSRGVGGRMATRRRHEHRFDHGASFLSASEPAFVEFIAAAGSLVEPWVPRVYPVNAAFTESMLVPVPAMNALPKSMLGAVRLRTQTEVAPGIGWHGGRWLLQDLERNELGEFDWVIVTAPPAQTLALLEDNLPSPSAVRRVRMMPSHALMLALPGRWEQPWNLALPNSPMIDRVVVDSDKPGRGGAVSVTVQTCADWSAQHIDQPPAELVEMLSYELTRCVGIDTGDADFCDIHRWRYALTEIDSVTPFQLDADLGLAAGGDWCRGNSVEAAWLTGRDIAAAVLARL